MKSFLTLISLILVLINAKTQPPNKDQIKLLGIKGITKYQGNIKTVSEYDKEGNQIKYFIPGMLLVESKVFYNKNNKPDSIITSHSINGIEKEYYKYSATSGFIIIKIQEEYKSTDTSFFDKENKIIRETGFNGKQKIYKYNEKKLLLQTIETTAKGAASITNYKYDEKARIITSENISSKNEIEYRNSYVYNIEGKLIKTIQRDKNDEIYDEIKYLYSGVKGLLSTSDQKFMNSKNIISSYEYEFY